MQSSVSFEKIIHAFFDANGDEYYFLSENDVEKKSGLTKELVKELASQGLIAIPRKSPEYEKRLKEGFIYEITDTKVAEKFFEAVMGLNSAGAEANAFEALVVEHGFSEKWEAHKKKSAQNALINWLVKSGISLAGQELASKIAVLTTDARSVPDEMAAFVPHSCANCKNNLGFEVSYFKTSPACENLLMEKEAGDEMKKQGFDSWQFLGKEKKELIAASKCSRCGSTVLNWDFK